MKLNFDPYGNQKSYPTIDYNCGQIPKLILDSLPNYNKGFTGVVIGNWYWLSDISDSLFVKQHIEISNGSILFKKSYVYQYHYLFSETFENDTIRQAIEYYPNGNLRSKAIWPLPMAKPRGIIHDEMLPKDQYFYNQDGLLTLHEYRSEGSIYNDMFTHYDSFNVHILLKDNKLVDVLNTNCLFVNKRGRIISKTEFMNGLESSKIENWSEAYFVEEEKPKCIDFIIHDDAFDLLNDRKTERLKKRLNKSCLEDR